MAIERRILIVTGDGGECYETLYAYHRFQEAGMVPVLAAPSKRRLHLVMHDFEAGWDTYVEKPGYGMDADIAVADAVADDYEAILLIGGRAPEYMRNDRRLQALVQEFDAKGKWIFAICHGIQIAVAAGVAKGRRLTCYEHVRCEVELGGGTYVDRASIRDRNMVSARTWQDHPQFFRDIFACLQPAQPAALTKALATV